jgi:hypothetical protein
MSTPKDITDHLSKEGFQLTREDAWGRGICIKCKKPPQFYSVAGRKEYNITALCEYCFDDIANPIVKCCGKHLEDCVCKELDIDDE